jgi:hypothetical protein
VDEVPGHCILALPCLFLGLNCNSLYAF